MAIVGKTKTLERGTVGYQKAVKEFNPLLHAERIAEALQNVRNLDLSSKEKREKAKEKVRGELVNSLRIKFQDVLIDKLLDVYQTNCLNAKIDRVTPEVALELLERCGPKDTVSKIKQFLSQAEIFGLSIDEVPVLFFLPLEDGFYIPFLLGEDRDGDISSETTSSLNAFILGAVMDECPESYQVTITGPRGGTMTIGRIYLKHKKTEGESSKVIGGCTLTF